MAWAIHRNTREFRSRANTPDLGPEWIINPGPDRETVEAIPQKYVKIDGDIVSEMTTPEKNAVDVAEIEAEKDSLSTNFDRRFRALVLALNDGTFVPGSNYPPVRIRNIIRDHL